MNPERRMRVSTRMRLHALHSLVVLTLAAVVQIGCGAPTGLDDTESSLVETHRAILDGVVRGELGQPLENVDIVVQLAGSKLPAPSTRTDAAGRFVLVLAIYNGTGGADSADARVYAFAQPPSYSSRAAGHANVLLRFLPVAQETPRTSLELRLPIF